MQGRFTSADELFAGQDEEDPQTWNLYAYTSGNPMNRIDPDGRRWFYKCDGKNGCVVQWVNPNDDGSYTSPGEGYIEFIPTKQREANWIGKTENAPWELVSIFIPGRISAKAILAGATALWAKHLAKKKATESIEAVARGATEIVAKDGTKITGFTKHGVNRAIGDGGKQAGTKPEAILDALKIRLRSRKESIS